MIDVIVIAKNSESNIEKLLLSLVKQKDFINVYLVDNATGRKEQDILKFYSKKYKFKLITLKNYNINLAKQEALSRTTSDYVCFLGGNDTVPDNFFEDLFDENYSVIFADKKQAQYTLEDLVAENISSSIYGKIIDKSLLIRKTLFNHEEREVLYKAGADLKIISKKVPGYVHVPVDLTKKEFENDFKTFLFYYDQCKYFRDEKYLKIAIEKMIYYGNRAYSKMIMRKDTYRVELNKIKSAYICLSDTHGAQFDVKTFNKIKEGKMTKNNLGAKKYEASKKMSKLFNKVKDEFKPIEKVSKTNIIKADKKRRVKRKS